MTPIEDLPTLCAALLAWAVLSALIGLAWEAVERWWG